MAKTKIKQILKWLAFSIVCLFLAFSFIVLSMEMIPSDQKIKSAFQKNGLDVAIHFIQIDKRSLRYLMVIGKDPGRPLLVFVHGAPGGCTTFNKYLQDSVLRQKFDMLSLDRPGYGPGDKGRAIVDIDRQSNYLHLLVKQELDNKQKVLFVSHSFGGPITALASLKLDTLVLGHIMLSPVISFEDEEEFWYAGIPLVRPFRWISSASWIVAAEEKLSHRKEVKKYSETWKNISTKIIHIHGQKDWLAPIENVSFCKTHFDTEIYSDIVLDEASHFIPWTKYDFIRSEIIRFVGD